MLVGENEKDGDADSPILEGEEDGIEDGAVVSAGDPVGPIPTWVPVTFNVSRFVKARISAGTVPVSPALS